VALAIDISNNIYIVGNTQSLNGISFNSNFQSQLYIGPQYNVDGYLAKFNENGNIIWGTYAGGENLDHLTSIAVKDNYLVVGGNTLSFNNISTSGVFQENHNAITLSDGMVYKFSNNGNRIWSTYYGGEQVDYIYTIEVDDEDNIYFGGETASNNNISTPGSFESSNLGGYSGYFVKLNSNGSRLWGSFLRDAPVNSIVFKNNSIYISATNGITSNPPNWTNACSYRSNGFLEGYIGKFSKLGSIVWGTFIGGQSSGSYADTVIAFDNNNNIFVSGQTRQSNTGIVDSNSYQQTILGLFNNYFLMKFHESDLCTMDFQPSSTSPICTSQSISFDNIPAGYTYNWSGPNDFISTIQNPTITNATNSNNGLYTLVISDGIACSCQKTYTFNILVEDNLGPIPSINSLTTINGDCNTIISTIPTALDNCAGTIIGTTTDPLAYSIPGNYTITWTYDDGNGNISSQIQDVLVTQSAIPIVNQNFYYCLGQNATINNIAITGENINWYDAQTGGTILTSTTALQNGVTYYATQTINGCESENVPVVVTIQNTAAPTGAISQTFCSTQNATVADISTSGTNVIWYADNITTTPLSNSSALADDTSYFATQTINGCESQTRFEVYIDLINTLNAVDYQEMLCDDLDNGFETINLSNYNSNFITVTGNTFSYYNSLNTAENQVTSGQITNISNYNLTIGASTIFVRIDSQNGCHQVVELQLTLVRKPQITIADIMPICEGSSITINAGNGYDTYNWSTGETTQSIVVSQTGNYSITVTENHTGISCSSTKNFTVVNSNAATVSQISTSDWTDNNNTITVLLTNSSVGNYVYSIDGTNYQSSNVFTSLQSGEYTVFVKDTNGCGIIDQEIYLLMYPKYFTPNGDSYNDTWKIKFSQNEPNSKIAIFDRYGKLITMFSGSSPGWDGTYNGNLLPATDYWFVVTRQNGKEFKGHFTLKR